MNAEVQFSANMNSTTYHGSASVYHNLPRRSKPLRAYSRMLVRKRAWPLAAAVQGELMLQRRRLLKSEEESRRASYECM